MRRTLFCCVATAIVTSVVVGGVAWALQSPIDGNGVIHACYNPTNGNMHLNVTGTCPATGQKTPITWSVTGPPGPPGPPGTPGPPGAIAAYQTGSVSQAQQLLSYPSGSGFPNLVGSIALPAGNFAVNATISFAAPDLSVNADLTCALVEDDALGPNGGLADLHLFGNNDLEVMPLNWTFQLSQPTTIYIGCLYLSGNNTYVEAREFNMQAIQVATVN
jgi:hypothetical protein